MASEPAERRLAAILSADVAGYSRVMAADEDATVRRLAANREDVPLLVRQHRGRLVDFTGDNFLAEFSAALDQGAPCDSRSICCARCELASTSAWRMDRLGSSGPGNDPVTQWFFTDPSRSCRFYMFQDALLLNDCISGLSNR